MENMIPPGFSNLDLQLGLDTESFLNHRESEWRDSQRRIEGLLNSEFRVLLGQIGEFANQINKNGPSPGLYGQFSQQLELQQTALIDELGRLEPYELANFNRLIDGVRTYLEEGILRFNQYNHWSPEYIQRLIRVDLESWTNNYLDPGMRHGVVPVEVCEYDQLRSAPNQEVLEQIEEISQGLKIDSSLLLPQEGFGRVVTASELAKDTKEKGARLFVIFFNRLPIGYFLLFANLEMIPSPTSEALRREFPRLKLGDGDGWTKVVGITKAGREILKNSTVHGYRAFTNIVSETAFALGINRLWGDVRVGPQGNLARNKHIAVGWIPTGVVYEHDGHPYEAILLEPASIAGSTERVIKSDRFGLARFNLPEYVYPRIPQDWLLKLKQWSFRINDVRNHEALAGVPGLDDSILLHKLKSALSASGSVEELRRTSRGFSIPFAIGRSEYSLAQKIPGADLWKIENRQGASEFYERGLGTRLKSFTEVLDQIPELHCNA